MYTCKYCKYSTEKLAYYNRHLKSSKHKKLEFDNLSHSVNNDALIKTINIDTEEKAIAIMKEQIDMLLESNQKLQEKYQKIQKEQATMKKRIEKIGKCLTLVGKASNEINLL
jgi:L-fucose mutarotase/ribose pyranase (RbsD/FucU family)